MSFLSFSSLAHYKNNLVLLGFFSGVFVFLILLGFFCFLFCWFVVFLQGDNCITSVLDCPTLKYVGCVSIFLCFFYLVLTFFYGCGFCGGGKGSSFPAKFEQTFWLSWRADL